MKSTIIYATMTNHSKKIATKISEQLSIPVYNIAENPVLENCDLAIIVSGIYGGEPKPELIEYIKGLSAQNVKKALLLTSNMNGGENQKVREALAENGIEVLPQEYVCQGGFLFFGFTHPNKTEIENAVSFVKKQLETL